MNFTRLLPSERPLAEREFGAGVREALSLSSSNVTDALEAELRRADMIQREGSMA